MLEKLKCAVEGRAPILAAGTNAVRIVDGGGDGVPGIEVDWYDGWWLVQTRDAIFPEWLLEVAESIGGTKELAVRGVYWKQLGEQKAAPVWKGGGEATEPFVVTENAELKYWIDFGAGYSQGIFLDQRENRLEVARRAGGLRVLNCFAYTCGFGVAAAKGGAVETVNIDLSKRYLEWGRRNYELNGIEPKGHEFIFGEVRNWLERFAKKGRKFDVVIMDPPTFSRDKEGKVFRVEADFPELVRAAEAVLSNAGSLFCSTNQRTLTPEGFRRLIAQGLKSPGEWRMEERRMPGDFTGQKYLKAVWMLHGGEA